MRFGSFIGVHQKATYKGSSPIPLLSLIMFSEASIQAIGSGLLVDHCLQRLHKLESVWPFLGATDNRETGEAKERTKRGRAPKRLTSPNGR